MKTLASLKYLFVWTGVLAGILSMFLPGIGAYSLPIYAFGIIPILELLLPADASNHSEEKLEVLKSDWRYDIQLYLIFAAQVGMIVMLCLMPQNKDATTFEIIGRIWATGIACGVLGINVAHELGHRHKKHEQLMAKILLLTSLYMHFFIEHNRGHHKHVSTPNDPATSRLGEPLYVFWWRSVWGSYKSAWQIENKRLRKLGKPIFSLANEMLIYQIVQIALVGFICIVSGWLIMLYFIISAILGFLLLETVNYIEHYGLVRKQLPNGAYEAVQPHHSWNSDHLLGRLLLFELSRHSDHHYRAARKYQTLRHMAHSPQMPTGYPGMMVLATIPPLWFWVMHRQMKQFESLN